MGIQTVFRRYESKYLLTEVQYQVLRVVMEPYMQADQFGNSTICNLYYDTPNFLMIRRSMEKPIYKEKLRLRSYGVATPDSVVFPELKKKYRGVVYKRRFSLPCTQGEAFFLGDYTPENTQIVRELQYTITQYENLSPQVWLSYEREAFYHKENGDFRMTFDRNILWRDYDCSLCDGIYGAPILPEGYVLLEVKTAGALPLWLTHFLTRERIFKTSFSKYGRAYQQRFQQNGGKLYG